MKNRMKYSGIAAAAAVALVPFMAGNSPEVKAASEADVIAAARAAGFPETYVQQGANYLQGTEYTPEQYDKMVSAILGYTGRTDEAIRQYLGEDAVPDSSSEENQAAEEQTPEVQNDGSASPEAGNTENAQPAAESGENHENAAPAKETKTDFSKMTEEEKDEYIKNMPQAEKNQILKNLDKEKQMEIINSMIDASSALGMNVSVDSFSKDKIEYSIRDDKGGVVDISSIGVIVDDTGINYTGLYIAAAGVVLVSAAGLIIMSRSLRGDRSKEL
ncbi:hypothetical protein [Ruminococcus sp. HUN007]|uniref:hypothetical protein n=1 Tax=Ruminococcus sp. HUN007 TaxID=1514668 RepID=UPI0005D21BB0|nr:hypothetical protein [Ruminococcus sp. HUN007]